MRLWDSLSGAEKIPYDGFTSEAFTVRIILSRKGFDSGAGGAPSPMTPSSLTSLPIPTNRRSETTYDDLHLGGVVEKATSGKIGADHLCHADPFFFEGRCAFGQTGSAQSHLANNGVCPGDVFLFFGLFQASGGPREHWIFAWQRIEEIVPLGPLPQREQSPDWLPIVHPHTIGEWNPNNTLYLGSGGVFSTPDPALRLTQQGGPLSVWRVPPWLKECGVTYHGNADRWLLDDRLQAVARGQEFVTDISGREDAKDWLNMIISQEQSM
jgi:hypothetical protein